jgi:hypothetical protein
MSSYDTDIPVHDLPVHMHLRDVPMSVNERNAEVSR